MRKGKGEVCGRTCSSLRVLCWCEVICVGVGQAGVQLSTRCWELFCLEHALNPEDGSPNEAKTRDNVSRAAASHSFG